MVCFDSVHPITHMGGACDILTILELAACKHLATIMIFCYVNMYCMCRQH